MPSSTSPHELKADPFARRPLEGPRAVAVLFDKPSTRTRLSFEVGHRAARRRTARSSTPRASQLGRGETIADTARVMSRYVAAIVWRTGAQSRIEEMAAGASVPVVNALTDAFHPCQVLADLQTVKERFGRLAGLTLAYLGDGANNMAHSLLLGGVTAGLHVRVCAPEGFVPAAEVLRDAKARAEETGGSAVELVADPHAAVDGRRRRRHRHVGVDGPGARRARPRGPVPAAAGRRRAAGPGRTRCRSPCTACRRTAATRSPTRCSTVRRSAVWDEAENRLHAQKALLTWLLAQDR